MSSPEPIDPAPVTAAAGIDQATDASTLGGAVGVMTGQPTSVADPTDPGSTGPVTEATIADPRQEG